MASTQPPAIYSAVYSAVYLIMDGMSVQIYYISSTCLQNLQTSHHAGVAPNDFSKPPEVPESAYTAALKEYEEDSETDSEGDMRIS